MFCAICTSLLINAVFFGITSPTPIAGSLMNGLTSFLLALIPTICGMIFEKHHPGDGGEAIQKIRRRKERNKRMKKWCRFGMYDPKTKQGLCCAYNMKRKLKKAA